jgi:hypothetical protein
MFASFARRPIAQQLIVATISAFVIVFAVLILVMQQKAESTAIKGTETNLEHEARLMAGMLDSTYEAVKIRGENESQFFRKYMGGQLEAGTGLVRTGDVDLPVVKLGNEVLNGQDRLLKAFRELAGSDAAFLMIHDNKVYRLATLLKDKDGKPMNGVPLPDSDPVAKALLAGQDYQGLAIRGGKYNFSTVKFLKEGEGLFGAHFPRKRTQAHSPAVRLARLGQDRLRLHHASDRRKGDRRIRHAPEVPGQADR